MLKLKQVLTTDDEFLGKKLIPQGGTDMLKFNRGFKPQRHGGTERKRIYLTAMKARTVSNGGLPSCFRNLCSVPKMALSR